VIRKGGIAEGAGGMSFDHAEFALLPTFFHQQTERVVPDFECAVREAEDGRDWVEIRHAATLVWHRTVSDRALLHKLSGYHILTSEEVDARFDQRPGPGVEVALLRVYRLEPSCRVAWQNSFGGCRSWTEMEADLDTCSLVSVLSDERFEEIAAELRDLLD
jgi:hypothetical protein